MNLTHDFKMMKQVLIEQQWMVNKIQKQEVGKMYTKKDHITIQSVFFFKNLSCDWHKE